MLDVTGSFICASGEVGLLVGSNDKKEQEPERWVGISLPREW